MMKRFALAAVLSLGALATSGCTLFGVKGQVATFNRLAVYRGDVIGRARPTSPILVVLYRADDHGIEFYDVLLNDNSYYLIAPPGDHRVVAFVDGNENYAYDPGEPIAQLEGPPVDTQVKPSAMGRIAFSDTAGQPPGFEIDLSIEGLAALMPRRANALSRVVTLDEVQFKADEAVLGLWRPTDFLKAGRHGIYMLSPYDPNKTPVLFIHGIGGSPAEFKKLAYGIDRTRFQPWFVHYPSGLSLDFNGWGLAHLIEENQARLGFQKLYVVAHSMGGLTAAAFLDWLAQDGEAGLVQLFVSISTPWAGHAAAAKAPSGVPMPSWKDISPESEFIAQLDTITIPSTLEYCLLFSHAGDSRLLAGGDDGTVTISSQLPYAAQNRASFVYGFNESHASILESDLVLSMLNRMLESKAAGRSATEGLRNPTPASAP